MATITVPFKTSHSFGNREQEVHDANVNSIEPRAPTEQKQPQNRWKTVLKVVLIVAVIAVAIVVGTKLLKVFSSVTKYPLPPLGRVADVPKGKPPLSASGYVKNIFPIMVQETETSVSGGALQLTSTVKPPLPSISFGVRVGLTVAMFGLALLGGPAGKVLSKTVDVLTGVF